MIEWLIALDGWQNCSVERMDGRSDDKWEQQHGEIAMQCNAMQ